MCDTVLNNYKCIRVYVWTLPKGLLTRDVPDFSFPNPAGFMTTNPAGAGAGFQNLVQRKTTTELQ